MEENRDIERTGTQAIYGAFVSGAKFGIIVAVVTLLIAKFGYL